MKKIIFLFLFFLLILGGKTSYAQGVGEILRGSLPRVSCPLCQQLGIKNFYPGHRVMVGNTFGGPCRIFIYGKEYLAHPGEVLWDVKYSIPKHQISIPIAALCYWDDELSQLAGWATHSLWLSGGWEPQAQSWMISSKDIVRDYYFHPQAETPQMRMRKVSFPRPYWEYDLGIQFLNASAFRIKAYINEVDMGFVGPQSAGFIRLAARGVPLGWGIQIIITAWTPQGVQQFRERVSWTGSFFCRQIVFDGQKIYPAS